MATIGTSLHATTTVPPGPVAVLKGVKGTVVDMDSGRPIAGAEVSVGGTRVLSGPDGTFTLEVTIRVGDLVTATKTGYVGARRAVGVATGGYGTCRLELLSLDSPNAPPVPPGA